MGCKVSLNQPKNMEIKKGAKAPFLMNIKWIHLFII